MDAKIVHACYVDGDVEGETFIREHVFSYIISGTQSMWVGNNTYHFKSGDFRFFRKNQLVKYIKKPESEGFRSLSVYLSEETLRAIQSEYHLQSDGLSTEEKFRLLPPGELLKKYVDSLSPYTNDKHGLLDLVVPVKVKELVLLLTRLFPDLARILFDYKEPGKIDLEGFMNEHYRYNVDLNKFAYLTGRSLSTFKRDFQTIFGITPGRWLIQKRLTEANYLIREKHKKPNQIYVDLGFENLSHFSFAFKKAFGSAPSLLE
ncbi:AraC family transcriptional regulator [uncultured Imperialibacter sp.]|uniref:AraC family transcriptional regulator n=1 Tax=uncultured Imperialibacter sp. TaxID=1672639 RepID=UPI0030DB5FAB|tara:strand:- start:3413 stop:4195 length:783 start_codon:yes stop_codon:yes gene_type:complete